MNRCIDHPDCETAFTCQKHSIPMCAECLSCRDLQIYCKFRISCAIHFVTRKGNPRHGGSAPRIPGGFGRPERILPPALLYFFHLAKPFPLAARAKAKKTRADTRFAKD